MLIGREIKRLLEKKPKKFRLIFLMNIDAKTFRKILLNLMQQDIKRIMYHDHLVFIPIIKHGNESV
jgi:predicted transcriptional regulator